MDSGAPQTSNPFWRRHLSWLLVGLVMLVVASIRFRLRDIPLERDEGEFAYQGQLMLQGIPPYQLAYNMKLPGASLMYAAMMTVFGQTSAGIHLGLLVVNAAAIALMFLLGRRLFDDTVGVMAAAAYATLSLSTKVMGLGAHATHFVVLPVLGAVLCLLRASRLRPRQSYFFAGLLFGLSFLMKQHAIFFPVFGAVWMAWDAFKKPRPLDVRETAFQFYLYFAGCLLPLLVTCLVFWFAGVFEMFKFWTFDYARTYVSAVSLSDGWNFFKYYGGRIFETTWPLLIIASAGLPLLWWQRPWRGRDTWLTAFLVFSFLTVCPGLYFRTNYFITLIPAVALLAGVAVSFLRHRLVGPLRELPVAVAVLALAIPVWKEREIFFQLTPLQACRAIHGLGPFPEAMEVAKYIREHSTKDARVAVIGSEPQIYFYAQRHSATGFIYTYSLVEPQPFAFAMQQKMIREIEANHPEFLVFVDVSNSWLKQPGSPELIFEWMSQYVATNYQLVGVAGILSLTETEYVWDDAVKNRRPNKSNNLFVLRRTQPAK